MTMTRQHFELIADVLANKLMQAKRSDPATYSWTLATIEDFMNVLPVTNPGFNKQRFVDYISKKSDSNLLI